MTLHMSRRIATVALLVALASAPPLPAASQPPGGSTIEVERAWTRSTGPTAQTAVAYVAIRNRGTAPDRLVSASSPEARVVEMHETTMEGGVMRMRPVQGGVAVPPGGVVRLEPDGGGVHLMLVGPRHAFGRGERVPLTLTFERAGNVSVEMTVEAAGARRPAAEHGGHGHGDHTRDARPGG
ncbi:copper chaperone PCu(A)C [Siccirubricoccus sp. KC 17139]|uniref:Copper chaperone PCu(A)C n=1 Tax=Siccirubricoccus soli TaxID=2899147 RepID=A0ABT1D2J2_9PROT|nr:copper chaperone PCu(A)C [Siccirubricoccus soli]MCO6416133.1 copper chaperone PCu(A)C [Siccirubricoccus soli]MCP2682267.1 copper chaperone PCu(A)C [Siccirubricoccus soli]